MARATTDTRQRLIETAMELIWRDSYGSVSVDDICARAKAQKGSFYHYFPSKADLVVATMDWCMDNIKARYDDIFSPTRPAAQRFELLVAYLYEKQEQIRQELGCVCGCPFATLGSELADQNKEISRKINEVYMRNLAYYESALRDLVAEGAIDPGTDIKIKAEQIYASIMGHMMIARIRNDLGFIKNNLEPAIFDLIGIRASQIRAAA